jgi:hypothetical protein
MRIPMGSRWLLATSVLLLLAAGGCMTPVWDDMIERTILDARKNSNRKYRIPATPEVWYGVKTVALSRPVCMSMCFSDGSKAFAKEVNRTLKDWRVADHFHKGLLQRLEGKVPFKLVETGPMSHAAASAPSDTLPGDKLLVTRLYIHFVGMVPKIAIAADWTVLTPDDMAKTREFAMMIKGQTPDFAAQQDPKALLAAIPKVVGGDQMVQTAHHRKDSWLGDEGRLVRAEMERLVDKLASEVARELLSTTPPVQGSKSN